MILSLLVGSSRANYASTPGVSLFAPPGTKPLDFPAGDPRIASVKTGLPWGSSLRTDIGPLLALETDRVDFVISGTASGYQQRHEILKWHNYYRYLEVAGATGAEPMAKLRYDFSLETYALEWSTYMCSNDGDFYEHSPNADSAVPNWPFRITTGENLNVSSSNTRPSSAQEYLSNFYSEKRCWDFSTGTKFEVCGTTPVGHYLALVNPDASTVGCSWIKNCDKNRNGGSQGFAWAQYFACQYDRGMRVGNPYELRSFSGPVQDLKTMMERCDRCPHGMDCCYNGLCSGPFTSDNYEPRAPATSYQTGFDTKCANEREDYCAGTGAVKVVTHINASPELDYQACSCSENTLWSGVFEVPFYGLLWYRNKCLKIDSGGRRLEEAVLPIHQLPSAPLDEAIAEVSSALSDRGGRHLGAVSFDKGERWSKLHDDSSLTELVDYVLTRRHLFQKYWAKRLTNLFPESDTFEQLSAHMAASPFALEAMSLVPGQLLKPHYVARLVDLVARPTLALFNPRGDECLMDDSIANYEQFQDLLNWVFQVDPEEELLGVSLSAFYEELAAHDRIQASIAIQNLILRVLNKSLAFLSAETKELLKQEVELISVRKRAESGMNMFADRAM